MRFLALLLGLVLAAPVALAAEPKRNARDDVKATTEAFGSVDRTAGWCDDATSTASNIWASSNVPAELGGDVDGVGTAAGLLERGFIRFLTIRIVDATDTTTPVCARLGPDSDLNTGRETLSCTSTSGSEQTNGAFIKATGEGRSFQIERINIADDPQLFVKTASGTVRYCVEVAWHQQG